MTRPAQGAAAAGRVSMAGFTTWLVLFGAVQVALALPGREMFAASSASAGLHYAGVVGTVAPLTDAFVAQALGLADASAGTNVADNASSLGVFAGSSIRDLDEVGCHRAVSGPADVRFPAEAGTAYFFQVGASLGARTVRFGLDPMGTTTRVPHLGDRTWADASCLPVEVYPYPVPHAPAYPALSLDGRYVVYESHYSKTWPHRCAVDSQVPLGGEEYRDVFLYDRVTGVTELVSVNSDGEPGNERSGSYVRNAVSADGRYVAFWSTATNLVPRDTNGEWNLFVRDRLTGTTSRVSCPATARRVGHARPRPCSQPRRRSVSPSAAVTGHRCATTTTSCVRST